MKQLYVIIVLISICTGIFNLQSTKHENNILTCECKSGTINDIKTEIVKPYSVLIAQTDVREFEEDVTSEPEEVMPMYDIPLSRGLQEFTYNKCKEYEVDYKLILAIIKTESNFKSDTISKNSKTNSDKGLMQINSIHKKNFRKMGFTDMLNPYENIEYGIKYFADLYHKFDGNEHYALSAYNKGEYAWRKLLKKGITSTNYSRVVIKNKNKIMELKEGD